MREEIMIHSVHIVSERKFLPWIKELFNRPGWSSDFIVLKYSKKRFINKIDDRETEVSTDEFGLQYILTLLENKNVAFHYFLDFPKTEIILRSGPGISHYWYFFGAEVYQQTNFFRKGLYGPETKKILRILPEIQFRYHLRFWYYRLLLGKKTPIQNLQKAIPRIKHILWYVDDEIDLLNKKLTLPSWLFLQFFTFQNIIPDETSKVDRGSKKILIGNSATIENNHMDVLKALKPNVHDSYQYTLPLTYGQFKRYKDKIKSSFQHQVKNKVYFLEEHMKLEEYYLFLNRHPTAVFLHYRQQGLGNIFYLLYSGTKIYLSRKNVIYHWLKKHGIEVFSFEDEFNSDFSNENLVLDDYAMEKNRSGIRTLLLHNKNDQTIKIIESEINQKVQSEYGI